MLRTLKISTHQWMLIMMFQIFASLTNGETTSIEIANASFLKSENEISSNQKLGSLTTSLPIKDVNILIISDIHSWMKGHGVHELAHDIGLGDILSFYKQLKNQLSNEEKDLWFVLNGDFIHGSILGQEAPIALAGILEQMPYDLVTLGNNDLQSSKTIEYMKRPGGLFDWWGSKLLMSNIFDLNKQFIGEPFRYLNGTSSKILTFGFLLDSNLHEFNDLIQYEKVEDTINLPWFREALENKDFNLILILAHMDMEDNIVQIIVKKIRKICGDSMMIQFVSGHTHMRDYRELDKNALSIELGHNLDTIGFVSLDLSSKQFNFSFIDANKRSLSDTIGMKKYMTPSGEQLNKFIDRTLQSSGGNEPVGCSPRKFKASSNLTETDSLLGLYFRHILPEALELKSKSVLLQSIEEFTQYDLFPGIITINDIWSIVPRNDYIHKISDSLKGEKINDLQKILTNMTTYKHNLNIEIKPRENYQLYSLSSEVSRMRSILLDSKMKVRKDKLTDEILANSEGPMSVQQIWINYIKKNWPYDKELCRPGNNDVEEVNNPKSNTTSVNEMSGKDQINKSEKVEKDQIDEIETMEKDQRSDHDEVPRDQQRDQAGPEKHVIQGNKTSSSPFGTFVAFSIVFVTLYVMARPYIENFHNQNSTFSERTTRVTNVNDLEMKPMGSRSQGGYQDIPTISYH